MEATLRELERQRNEEMNDIRSLMTAQQIHSSQIAQMDDAVNQIYQGLFNPAEMPPLERGTPIGSPATSVSAFPTPQFTHDAELAAQMAMSPQRPVEHSSPPIQQPVFNEASSSGVNNQPNDEDFNQQVDSFMDELSPEQIEEQMSLMKKQEKITTLKNAINLERQFGKAKPAERAGLS